MRILTGILIMLLLLIGFSLFIFRQTFEIAEGLTAALDQIEETVQTDQWDKASRVVEELKEQWGRADAWWSPFMDHQEIDLLDQSIVRVARLVEVRRKEDALVEISVARTMIKSISELQRPGISNIF
ncbi:MAG: hypothetical protein CVU88_00355 [Firmicutes bacterium HGW-Firmicutes-13]|nr:MAG: hypothetical protein CVU88_00355 [Firmicutes bacterium HGW-Firmicutes-13]